MNTLYLVGAALAAVLLLFRFAARHKAIKTMRGIVRDFNPGKGDAPCISCFTKYQQGIEVWDTFKLKGKEFGVGCRIDFCIMAIEANCAAVKFHKGSKNLQLVKGLREQQHELEIIFHKLEAASAHRPQRREEIVGCLGLEGSV
jgi:hypothetical protein